MSSIIFEGHRLPLFVPRVRIKAGDSGAYLSGRTGHYSRTILSARDLTTNSEVVIKRKLKLLSSAKLLHEAEAYAILHTACRCPGIPFLYHSGSSFLHHHLILDRHGANLLMKHVICGGSFSARATMIVAWLCLHRIAAVHRAGLILRNVHPKHFVVGRYTHNRRSLYILDLSETRRFQGSELHSDIIPFCAGAAPTKGGLFFSSPRADAGRRMTCADDLISLSYMLVFLHCGSLPWTTQAILARRDRAPVQKYMKRTLPVERIVPSTMPSEMTTLLEYAYKLDGKFPDYDMLVGLFGRALRAMGEWDSTNFEFDWPDASFESPGPVPCRTSNDFEWSQQNSEP